MRSTLGSTGYSSRAHQLAKLLITWKKPWMVLSERPRSCCSARKRLSLKALSCSRFSTPPELRYQSIFCWYQSMVRELRPITFSSSSHSRSSARTGCRPRRGWTRTPTSTRAGAAAPATRGGATFGGRPGLRLNPASGLFTVCDFHNGFWMFSTDLTLPRRWPHRCPKTTKTGPQGRSSEFNLRGESPLRKCGGEGEIRTLDGPVTHNGFRDRRLQPDSATSPQSAWEPKWRSRPDSNRRSRP